MACRSPADCAPSPLSLQRGSGLPDGLAAPIAQNLTVIAAVTRFSIKSFSDSFEFTLV